MGARQEPSDEDRAGNRGQALSVLHLEDNPQDALLLNRQLRSAGYSPEVDVVSEAKEFLDALRSKQYDIILADHNLPGWSGTDALQMLRRENGEIPFILVTGTLGEENAVECIKMGATDYVLKDRPARLALAVKRALQEKIAKNERKKAEQTRDRLAALVESSDDAIISVTLEGLIDSWNSGAERIYGYGKQEIRGKALSHLFAPSSLDAVDEALRRLRSGQSTERYQTSGVAKSGSAIHVALTMSPMPTKEGEISVGSVVIRDITQHFRLEEQLRHSQKMDAVGRLAGGVAHDFNNLLTVILGYARMLQTRLPPGDSMFKTVGEIRRAAEQAAALTKQLLAFSRKQLSERRALDLADLVDEIRNMIETLLGPDVVLAVVRGESLPSVKADSAQISQVLINLAANARDAMPAGGKIVIETENVTREHEDVGRMGIRPAGQFVALTVSDTGSGMDLETQSHIFEPFFTTKDLGKGTGLGLSTVYGIVQQHGGWIDVYSELGSGTMFKIFLPAVVESAVRNAGPPMAGELTATRPGTILLVEDQAPVRIFAEEVLAQGGHRVLCADSGPAAIEMAGSFAGNIDLLITDVIMPGMNGPDLAGYLSKSRPGLVVLYVSGYSGQALLFRETIRADTAFLQKPFLPEALLAEVDKLLSRSPEASKQ